MTEWLLVGLGVLLTFGTALFVAAEFSLVALDRSTVERAVEEGQRGAPGVLAAVRSLSTQLSGAQVGITLTTLVVGYLTQPSIATLLRGPLGDAGLDPDIAGPLAVALALILATGFSMVVGELVPKNLAISVPLPTARVVAGPHRAFTALMSPLITVLNGSANRILRAVGVEPQEELSIGRSPEELASLVRRSAEAGTLDRQTATLITRSLGFTTHTAADVMTPRVRMHVLRRDAAAAEVVALARRTGHSRFPVVEGSLDDVVGVVHLKSAIAVPRERRDEVPVAALMADALRVPETVRLDPLLADLRSNGLQLAVVVDEYGGTAGVVTLEDLVEELVGEVADEHDRNRPGIVRRRDGSWLVPGLMRPDEVRDRTGVVVPSGNAYETVGGFVMAALGRIPRQGDEVPLEGGSRLRVERMEARRVDRLRLLPAERTGATAVTRFPAAARPELLSPPDGALVPATPGRPEVPVSAGGVTASTDAAAAGSLLGDEGVPVAAAPAAIPAVVTDAIDPEVRADGAGSSDGVTSGAASEGASGAASDGASGPSGGAGAAGAADRPPGDARGGGGADGAGRRGSRESVR